MGLGLSSLASLIALKQGAKVLYITPNKVNIGSGSILQLSFPHTLFKNYADLLNEKNVTEIDTISKKIFSKLKRPEDILNIKYNNVTIGTFIYDTILRTGNWKAYISELNSEVESVIKSAIKLCYALDELAKKFNIVSAVFSHSIGINIGGIPLRYLVEKHDKTVFCGRLGSRNIRKYNRSSTKEWLDPLWMIPNDIFLKISNKKDLYDSTLKSADKYLLNRTNAKANDLDSVRAYAGNKVFSKKQEFCSEFNLDINKPIVFVMLHAFNDFPHHFKNNIFLIITIGLKSLKNCEN